MDKPFRHPDFSFNSDNFTDRNILVKEKSRVSKNLKVTQDSYYEKLLMWLNSIHG